ncbi:DUF4382 domain-containing protein [Natronomonas halophila]|uniref:DUF4382 domain-containing protein n=1 Tax=Natronomonas halophila TaxID=2747817 RepID=UPI001FE9DF84|nr:DUF4382 domain-containing protein [Natronomonas halophila]
MRRRDYLVATGSAVAVSAFAGCMGGNGGDDGNGGNDSGLLATRVTDQPGDIDDFESCVVTITAIRLKPAEGDDEGTEEEDTEGTADETATPEETPTESEGTETEGDDEAEDEVVYEVDDVEADLVELQDGNTKLVDEREIETGEYEYMKLTVSEVNGTLKDGGETEVDTPGNAPLKFNESFEIRANTRTVFTADFTPVKRGQQNSYILQPVASGVEVSYEDVETDDGTENGTDQQTETPTEA